MRIMWVNNVGNICGGTLACTHSMVKALPDCHHIVFSFNRFTQDAIDAFPDDVELVSGADPDLLLCDEDVDVLVLQNTDGRWQTKESNAVTVHYLHSAYSGAVKEHHKHNVQFCVSKWLANQTKTPVENVLHQPVLLAPEGLERGHTFTIGRICTPEAQKWAEKDVIPPLEVLLKEAEKMAQKLNFELVGCPPDLRKSVSNVLGDSVKFYDAEFSARKYLRRWHVMLYCGNKVESFGRTVREAQRVGCVPVVPNLGGFVEQIVHPSGNAGILFNVSPVEAVKTLIGNRQKWQGYHERCLDVGNSAGSLQTWRTAFLERLEAKCQRTEK